MALENRLIRRDRVEPISLDFEKLREEGIQLAQQLSGKRWTDYNPHDPGVTILEQLCYALTDIGYRSTFPIREQLYAKLPKGQQRPKDSFFDASDILPTNPVTLEDYRILIIDYFPEITNAWLHPVQSGMRGQYRIFLQLAEAYRRDAQRVEEIKDAVQALFAAHRNLAEDVSMVEVLAAEQLQVQADVDIDTEEMGEAILARLLLLLENHINPPIPLYSLDELLEEGYTIEQIFSGPPAKNGFIKKEDLGALNRSFYVSKIIELINGLPGVKRVSNFYVTVNGLEVEGDVLRLPENTYLILDMNPLDDRYRGQDIPYPIRFFRGQLQYELDLNTANQLYHSQDLRYKKGYTANKIHGPSAQQSSLKRSDLGAYHSVQHLFPHNYGLGTFGLPSTVRPSRERYAAIRQLKAYLLFFEQQLANHLAQLAQASDFFSLDPELDRSYFFQLAKDSPRTEELLKGGSFEAFEREVDALMRKFDPFLDRRNRVLDHLLARFGEYFLTDFLLQFDKQLGQDVGSVEEQEAELLQTKLRFLQNYVSISRNRSRGFNYLEVPSSENRSGLEQRVRLLLNIPEREEVSLLSGFDERLQDYKREGEDWESEVQNLPLDEEELPYEEIREEDEEVGEGQFCFSSTEARLLQDLLLNGVQRESYSIHHNPDTESPYAFIVLYKGGQEGLPQRIYQAKSLPEARQAIQRLLNYLLRLSKQSEGFHLVEHLLLRPLTVNRFALVLLDDQKRPLLETTALSSEKEQLELRDELFQLGQQRANYSIAEQEEGQYFVMLSYYNRRLSSLRIFDSEKEAEQAIENCIAYLESFRNMDITAYQEQVLIEDRGSVGQVQDAQFYSNQITLVLPDWPSRFQNPDFQNLLRDVVLYNAPAHLHTHFIWLDPEAMQRFEDLYFDWMAKKRSLHPEQPSLDEAAYELLLFVKNAIDRNGNDF